MRGRASGIRAFLQGSLCRERPPLGRALPTRTPPPVRVREHGPKGRNRTPRTRLGCVFGDTAQGAVTTRPPLGQHDLFTNPDFHVTTILHERSPDPGTTGGPPPSATGDAVNVGLLLHGRNAPGATRASLTAAVASSAVAPEPWRPRHAPAKPRTGPRPPSWSPRRGRVDADQVEATRLGARRAGSLGQLGALPPGRCRSRRPLLLHSSPVEPPTAACGGELRRGRARTPWRTRRPPPALVSAATLERPTPTARRLDARLDGSGRSRMRPSPATSPSSTTKGRRFEQCLDGRRRGLLPGPPRP